jgi:hypothetical protein
LLQRILPLFNEKKGNLSEKLVKKLKIPEKAAKKM